MAGWYSLAGGAGWLVGERRRYRQRACGVEVCRCVLGWCCLVCSGFMGFADAAVNRRALEASNGDVAMAVWYMPMMVSDSEVILSVERNIFPWPSSCGFSFSVRLL